MEKNTPFQGRKIPVALTIAGSDSGGGAGIQADLRTFAAFKVHGLSAITSVTAQDTLKVHTSEDISPVQVGYQIEAVLTDIGADAVKTGMLSSGEIIETIVTKLLKFGVSRLVVDPVMASTRGDALIKNSAVEVLKRKLFPLALVITPNLHEAEVLVGRTLADVADIERAAEELHSLGCSSVIIKGGHARDTGKASDLFFDGDQMRRFEAPRLDSTNTHGSGCTFAAAITACLARGHDLEGSILKAKRFVTGAIEHSYPLGHGSGPLNHLYRFWED